MAHAAEPTSAPAYQRLAAQIRQEIQIGELLPGDRLPSESQLASDADVSRSTVREALRTLQEAGFVERASPRIMIVSRRPQERDHRQLTRVLRRQHLTFDRLHEALVLLDPELSRLAALRATPADIDELDHILVAQQRALADYQEWNRLDQEFHMTIAEIADNAALLLARAPVSRVLLPALREFVTTETATGAALRWHRRILDEVAAGESEAAALMTRRHVDDFRAAWIAAGLDPDQSIESDDESA
jgi:GntR family transcriptional regulator, transcriptional repressor for pyruvate dehydrogenase complex